MIMLEGGKGSMSDKVQIKNLKILDLPPQVFFKTKNTITYKKEKLLLFK
jgi:hypothetical protein